MQNRGHRIITSTLSQKHPESLSSCCGANLPGDPTGARCPAPVLRVRLEIVDLAHQKYRPEIPAPLRNSNILPILTRKISQPCEMLPSMRLKPGQDWSAVRLSGTVYIQFHRVSWSATWFHSRNDQMTIILRQIDPNMADEPFPSHLPWSKSLSVPQQGTFTTVLTHSCSCIVKELSRYGNQIMANQSQFPSGTWAASHRILGINPFFCLTNLKIQPVWSWSYLECP